MHREVQTSKSYRKSGRERLLELGLIRKVDRGHGDGLLLKDILGLVLNGGHKLTCL